MPALFFFELPWIKIAEYDPIINSMSVVKGDQGGKLCWAITLRRDKKHELTHVPILASVLE